MSSVTFHNDVDAVGLYREFSEEDSALPTMPLSPDMDEEMDPDLRARRRSSKKAARVLGITEEDMEDSPMRYAMRSDSGVQDNRRASLSQLNLTSLSLRDSPRASAPDVTTSDEEPLLGGSTTRRSQAGKAYKRLGKKLLGPFHLSSVPKGKGRKRKLSSGASPLFTSTLASPFRDKRSQEDMDWEDEGAAGPSCSTPADFDMSAPDEVTAPLSPKTPRTPRRARHASAPTTPRTSPLSAKSRRSSTGWQRTTPRTPLSAKSWRSTSDSSPGTGSDRSPGALRRRAKRRRARDMASQTKILQLLGPEATGAVAKATNVKETKLRYRDFGRQLHDRLRRDL